MDGVRRKGGQANSNILCATRCAVTHPFSRRGDHGLPGAHLHLASFVVDVEHSRQNYGDLMKLGPLSRLLPTGGRLHPCDTDIGMTGVYAARVFLDQFWFVTRAFNGRRFLDQLWHLISSWMVSAILRDHRAANGHFQPAKAVE